MDVTELVHKLLELEYKSSVGSPQVHIVDSDSETYLCNIQTVELGPDKDLIIIKAW